MKPIYLAVGQDVWRRRRLRRQPYLWLSRSMLFWIQCEVMVERRRARQRWGFGALSARAHVRSAYPRAMASVSHSAKRGTPTAPSQSCMTGPSLTETRLPPFAPSRFVETITPLPLSHLISLIPHGCGESAGSDRPPPLRTCWNTDGE